MSFRAGLTHDPDNEDLKDGLRRASVEIKKLTTGPELTEALARVVADPELRAIMSDPVVQQVLAECTSNQAAAAANLKNAGVAAAKVQKLVDRGIIQR